jgi:hypothetical protein
MQCGVLLTGKEVGRIILEQTAEDMFGLQEDEVSLTTKFRINVNRNFTILLHMILL